jgi:hypothetical protein
MKQSILQLIIIALLGFVIWTTFNKKSIPETTVVNVYDTTTYASNSNPQPIYVTLPKIELITPPLRANGEVDSAKIFQDYYSKLTYIDSLFIDSNIIKINDTITQNRIAFRKVTLKDLKPSKVIYQNAPQKPTLGVYGGIGYSPYLKSVGISTNLTYEKFGFGYTFFNNQNQNINLFYKLK